MSESNQAPAPEQAPDPPELPKRKPGRPGGPETLLPEQREAFLAALRVAGTSRDLAAHRAGIAPRTLYRWLERGRRTAYGTAAKDEPYRQFWQDVRRAEADAELAAIARIYQAGQPRTVTVTTVTQKGNTTITQTRTERQDGDWGALAWILERRKPAKYGRRETRVHQGDAKHPVVFELDVPSPRAAREPGDPADRADFGDDDEGAA